MYQPDWWRQVVVTRAMHAYGMLGPPWAQPSSGSWGTLQAGVLVHTKSSHGSQNSNPSWQGTCAKLILVAGSCTDITAKVVVHVLTCMHC